MSCNVCIGSGDYDPAPLYSRDMVKARKPHKCIECGRVINSGEVYERVNANWDNKFTCLHTCATCAEIANVFSCGEGRIHHSLWDDMRELAFPELTTGTDCFRELSPAAKERVLAEWRGWKGLAA